MRYTAIISLGSNAEDSEVFVNKALANLSNFGRVLNKTFISSEDGYFNSVAELSTTLDYPSLVEKTKEIEKMLGRLPEHKEQGRVDIDIDVVIYDSQVMRQHDAETEYFMKGMKLLNIVKSIDNPKNIL